MARSTRALSGAAKDAYLKRVVAAEPGLDAETRARLTRRLQVEIALVSLRIRAAEGAENGAAKNRSLAAFTCRDTPACGKDSALAAAEPASSDIEGPGDAAPDDEAAASETRARGGDDGAQASDRSSIPFDPYSPNVIVGIRTRGREAVLAELQPIDDVASLRLLAREQQLGIAPDLEGADEIRRAIVLAAERRIANRRAAAS